MKLDKISKVAKKLGLASVDLYPQGYYMAKINLESIPKTPRAKLVLVTAMTPTKAGEGKTTTSIAITDALDLLGANACVVLREPSLGPVFGMKGGATGGGKATVEPQEDINLHFTGDIHALTTSINLIAAVIDNHIYSGNALNLDPERIVFKRAIDMNDRALREITVAQGEKNGVPRKEHFVITVAHEMMAILCLAKDKEDFKKRLGNMIVGYTYDDQVVTVKDLKVTNAVMKLMKNAFLPNLVQTSHHAPAIIHGGPFANIAHGCNSIIATKAAMSLAEIVVTEAGFGSDLGAEKFLDITCPEAGIKPDLVIVVATIKALKLHGGVKYADLNEENIDALKAGLPNLERHVENMRKYGMSVIVNINKFGSDTPEEIKYLSKWCAGKHYNYEINDAFARGAKGAVDMGNLVLRLLREENSNYHPLVTKEMTIEKKIETICKEIYGASGVEYSEQAKEDLQKCHDLGYDDFYVCMAKTPMSFSDNKKLLGAPTDFNIHIRRIDIAAGSRFIIPITGKVMTMPGLPKVPAAVKMEEEEDETTGKTN
ncbi:MAG: formate--tetrahydrofolate ligase [Bacilli bacterium]